MFDWLLLGEPLSAGKPAESQDLHYALRVLKFKLDILRGSCSIFRGVPDAIMDDWHGVRDCFHQQLDSVTPLAHGPAVDCYCCRCIALEVDIREACMWTGLWLRTGTCLRDCPVATPP